MIFKHCRRTRTARLLFPALLYLGCASIRADECRDILEQGVRNTYQSLRNSNLRSAFTDGLCGQTLQTVKSSSGGGLSLAFPVDGVPVKFGGDYNESSGSQFRQEACHGVAGDLSDSNYESVLQAVADPAIVAAWSQCKRMQGGVLLTGELNGSTLVMSIRFRNIGNIHETELMGNLAFSGVTCPDSWRDGMIVDGSERFLQCKRIGTDPVTITVNTRFNGARFKIPAPEQLEVAATPKRHAEPPAQPRSSNPSGQTIQAKVCIRASIPNNRCPAAGESAEVGARCSCQPPFSPVAFNDGVVQNIEIRNVLQAPQGPIPAPGQ